MKKHLISWLCKSAALLACASTAHAVVYDAIRYSTDNSTWTEVDDVANSGTITTSFTVAGFHITVVSSLTYPLLGTQASPQMDLDVTGATTGSGTLYIEFSTINFTPKPTGSFITTLGANNGTGVTQGLSSRVGKGGSGDTLFAGGANAISLGSLGPITSGTIVGSGTAPGQSDPYSITLAEVLTSTGGNVRVSNDDSLNVPDGGNTLMLLGSALSVLGLGMFRNSRKSAVVKA